MFLGYQNNKIVLTANTREELENAPCMTFDEIVETEVNYTLYNGEYLTDVELAEKQKEATRKELIAQLSEIDEKEIRSMAAIAAGTATDEDRQRLTEYEAQKEAIRQHLQEL